MFKKWSIRFGIALLTLIVVVALGLFLLSEPLPSGTSGAEADTLAARIQQRVHHQQWLTTGAVRWTYAGRHHFLWDRQRHYVIVEWKNYRAIVNLDKVDGVAYEKNQRLSGETAKNLIRTAWRYWVNDSFWLNPLAKIFDAGTTRQLIELSSGGKGLLVSYGDGGVTPGDAYLWHIDDDYYPTKWQMWVNIIPIGGLAATWEDWVHLPTGALISTAHQIGPLRIRVTDLDGAANLQTLLGEQTTDPFAILEAP